MYRESFADVDYYKKLTLFFDARSSAVEDLNYPVRSPMMDVSPENATSSSSCNVNHGNLCLFSSALKKDSYR
jgi:hypothetical protein